MRKRICDHAEDVLRETDNPAVMWGDCWLLDEIKNRAGIDTRGPGGGHQKVLNALSRQPGNLIPTKVKFDGVKPMRCFRLPEPEEDVTNAD